MELNLVLVFVLASSFLVHVLVAEEVVLFHPAVILSAAVVLTLIGVTNYGADANVGLLNLPFLHEGLT